jgi:hypothetical protein
MQYPLMRIGVLESGAYDVAMRDACIMSDDHSSRMPAPVSSPA